MILQGHSYHTYVHHSVRVVSYGLKRLPCFVLFPWLVKETTRTEFTQTEECAYLFEELI